MCVSKLSLSSGSSVIHTVPSSGYNQRRLQRGSSLSYIPLYGNLRRVYVYVCTCAYEMQQSLLLPCWLRSHTQHIGSWCWRHETLESQVGLNNSCPISAWDARRQWIKLYCWITSPFLLFDFVHIWLWKWVKCIETIHINNWQFAWVKKSISKNLGGERSSLKQYSVFATAHVNISRSFTLMGSDASMWEFWLMRIVR